MLKLRPHHMMCLAFYKGKGYSLEFVEHISGVMTQLETTPIVLVEGCDMICKKCPHLLPGYQCETEEKVKDIDQKVMEGFGLNIGGCYTFVEWKKRLVKQLNANSLQKICGRCEWYHKGVCRLEDLKKNE